MLYVLKFMFLLFFVGFALMITAAMRRRAFLFVKNSLAFIKIKKNYFLKRRRARKIEKGLPEAISIMESGLKSGYSLELAFKMAAEELEGPVGEELSNIIDISMEQKSLDDALIETSKRYGSKELDVFAQSVSILRRSGGNLVELFERLKATIRQRNRINTKIDLMVSQGKIQIAVLSMMPWALLLSLSLLSPKYIIPLFSTRIGVCLLIATIVLQAVGLAWMKKIINVEV